jgi:hypothetical protein
MYHLVPTPESFSQLNFREIYIYTRLVWKDSDLTKTRDFFSDFFYFFFQHSLLVSLHASSSDAHISLTRSNSTGHFSLQIAIVHKGDYSFDEHLCAPCTIFRWGDKKKSLGANYDEEGGWLRSSNRNSLIFAMVDDALSWWNGIFFFCKCGRFPASPAFSMSINDV